MNRSLRNVFNSGLLLFLAAGCGVGTFGKSSLSLRGPVNLGLVGLWSMDEMQAGTVAGGADFADGSESGNPATATAGVTLGNAGRFGNGARFNGVGYASAPHGSALNVGNSLTVAAWIYPTNLSKRNAFFSTRSANRAGSFQVEVGVGNSGSNVVSVASPGVWNAQTSNNVVTLNSWNHVVYTRDGTSVGHQKIYLNGVELTLTIDSPVVFVDNTDLIDLGRGAPGIGAEFIGSIDELSVWNRALSSTEVSYLYQLNLVPYLEH